jgi:hypothetical protein
VSLLKKIAMADTTARVADLAGRVANNQGLDVFAGEALPAATMAALASAG